jgi:uncharacterized protein (TIGR00369 family)
MKKVPSSKACFVCGTDNPISMKLETYYDEDGNISANYIPEKKYSGWENIIHGGIISAILDEVMVWVPWAATGKYFFTGEITVRFMKPLLAGTQITAKAKPLKRGSRVFETSGEIRDAEETIYATATGKYIAMRESQQTELAQKLTKS